MHGRAFRFCSHLRPHLPNGECGDDLFQDFLLLLQPDHVPQYCSGIFSRLLHCCFGMEVHVLICTVGLVLQCVPVELFVNLVNVRCAEGTPITESLLQLVLGVVGH